ncbi:MAG: Tat pathway signal sequence domain protein [Spirochaetes bacterium]|nr:Tat pathway signal sequence domain protein [Spirochaetota bacterium]
MRPILALGVLLAMSFAAGPDPVDWAAFLGRNDLTWDKAPTHWTRGPFLGNGELGAMIYHEPTNEQWVRLELSRSDAYTKSGSGGIRVPTGHLYLKPAGRVQSVAYRLVLRDAEAVGTLTTDKGAVRWRAFIHADEPVLRLELEGTGGEDACAVEYAAERAVNARKVIRKEPLLESDLQPEPVVTREGDGVYAWQPWTDGGGAATAVREIRSGPKRLIAATMAVGWKDDSPRAEAKRRILSPRILEVESARATHRAWWRAFYGASFLTLPDARLESFYWAQLYKIASATRADRPPIDLMGPWYQPSAWLAYWMNLNIQLTYWPVYAANHLELGESLSRWVAKWRDSLVSNAPAEWRGDSAALGRVTGMDLRGNAGEELGNLPFLLHNLYWQYRYSMDEALLRDLLYPLLSRSVNFYRHKFVKIEDGKYHLPLAVSPEYEQKAEDCNYDLALCRWACEVLLASAARLHIDDPLIPAWKDILSNLAPYPVDETGIMIGKGVPLAHSHRHFSHLFMIFPLATMKFEGQDRALVEKSIRHWLDLTGAHAGYSYTGGAAMAAYLGDGDRARSLLDTFCDRYVKPNTFYTEGGFWPVIETPLAGARSIQEMLLQSWGGTLRIFPGVPKDWADASFRDLRAEGAFLVSALRAGGRTRWIRIESLAGEPCLVKTELQPVHLRASRPMSVSRRPEGLLELPLAKGDWAVLSEEAGADPELKPVARSGIDNPWGTVKRPPPPPLTADASGVLRLMASNASIQGDALTWFKDANRDTLGRWTKAGDAPFWRVRFPTAGRWTVGANYGHPGGGSTFVIKAGEASLEGTIQGTGDFDKPKDFELGVLAIPAAGIYEVRMEAKVIKGGAVCNLRGLTLRQE